MLQPEIISNRDEHISIAVHSNGLRIYNTMHIVP